MLKFVSDPIENAIANEVERRYLKKFHAFKMPENWKEIYSDYYYYAKKDGFPEAEIYSMIKDIILKQEKERIIADVTAELNPNAYECDNREGLS